MVYFIIIIFFSGLLYIYYIENFRDGLVKLNKTTLLCKDERSFPGITVIVSARNEENYIAATLDSLSRQNYPEEKLTIIAVNDRSKDSTGMIMDEYGRIHPNLSVMHIKDVSAKVSPKKNAILKAVNSAPDELIITTDADCTHHPNWVRSLVSPIMNEKDANIGIVAGLTVFKKKYRSLFERVWQNMQNIDYVSHSLIAAGSIGKGKAFTANGSNLLIRKSLYMMEENIKSEIASGDDFFIIQAAKEHYYDLRFVFNSESIVESIPVSTIPDLIDQRARWASKTPYSSDFVLYFAVNTFIFYTGLMTAFILMLFSLLPFWIFIVLFSMKFIPETIFLSYGFGKAGINFKIRYYLLLQAVHIPFNLLAAVKGKYFGFRWKGVKYKY